MLSSLSWYALGPAPPVAAYAGCDCQPHGVESYDSHRPILRSGHRFRELLVSPETSSPELLLRTLSPSTAFETRRSATDAPRITAAAMEVPALAVLSASLVSWLRGCYSPNNDRYAAPSGAHSCRVEDRLAFGEQKPETLPYPSDRGLLAVPRKPIGLVRHFLGSRPQRHLPTTPRGAFMVELFAFTGFAGDTRGCEPRSSSSRKTNSPRRRR